MWWVEYVKQQPYIITTMAFNSTLLKLLGFLKQLFLLVVCVFLFTSLKKPVSYFSGKIVYTYQFADGNGRDITNTLSKLLGKEQHYFVNDQSYKSYDEKGHYKQLYNSGSNTYYYFTSDTTAHRIDASKITSKVFAVKQLEDKEKIAGYDCSSVEIKTDDATTTYFFTPLVAVHPTVFARHKFGEWDRILLATNGAIPLKFKMIYHKQGFMTWTSSAMTVIPQKLEEGDFKLPGTVQLQ